MTVDPKDRRAEAPSPWPVEAKMIRAARILAILAEVQPRDQTENKAYRGAGGT